MDLVGLVLQVEEVAVSLLDRKNGYLLNCVEQIRGLADRDSPLVGLHCLRKILSRNGIAEDLR